MHKSCQECNFDHYCHESEDENVDDSENDEISDFFKNISIASTRELGLMNERNEKVSLGVVAELDLLETSENINFITSSSSSNFNSALSASMHSPEITETIDQPSIFISNNNKKRLGMQQTSNSLLLAPLAVKKRKKIAVKKRDNDFVGSQQDLISSIALITQTSIASTSITPTSIAHAITPVVNNSVNVFYDNNDDEDMLQFMKKHKNNDVLNNKTNGSSDLVKQRSNSDL